MESKNNLSETLIVLIGVWLIITPVPNLLANIFAYSLSNFGESGMQILIRSIGYFVAQAICGSTLIMMKAKIVTSLGLATETPSDSHNLLSASIFLLGVYFMLKGFISLGEYYFDSSSTEYHLWHGTFSMLGGIIVGMLSVRLGKFWWLLKRS